MIYRTLEEANKGFEDQIKKIDETKFENLNNFKINKDFKKKFVNKIEMDNFIEEWINEDGFHHFHEYEKESYYRKILSNSWDFVVDWSINGVGNQHFAVTINMPLNRWFDGKHLYDYDSFKLEEYLELETELKNHILNGFKSTTFIFIVAEKNESGVLHFHILISIRNFIDYNYTLKNNLLLWLKGFSTGIFYSNDLDIKVNSLIYYKDVKNWAIYMYKDMYKWKFPSKIYILQKYYQNVLEKYLSQATFGNLHINCEFNKIEIEENKFLDNLNGIKITQNKIDQRTLINLLQYYLILNEYFIYNENIYVKVEESKISYRLVGSIREVLYDKFQENVAAYYNLVFENYFIGFDFSFLMDNYFVKAKNVIESIRDISTQRIEPNFGLIEFTDGVYSIKYDRFFPNSFNFNYSNVSTIKYYNKAYGRLRKEKPITWISGLKNALNIKTNELTNEDYVRLCLHIINPIHKDIFNKKSTLYLHGQSNTGKTALVGNVLIDYFGQENVGSVINAKNFKYQELMGKMVGIIDEGRYSYSMSSDLLKLTASESVVVEKKYSKEHITINPIPLIIISNILFKDDDKLIDQALKNRLYVIEFFNTISRSDMDNCKSFKDKLRDEEAKIIIYCNKLLFKLNQGELKRIGDSISNVKVLELIKKGK